MSTKDLPVIIILIIIILIAFALYFINIRCPKCNSIRVKQQQKALFRKSNNGKEYFVTYRCKKCNNVWSGYITENTKKY